MTIPPHEHENYVARFPASLRALVLAELTAGNLIAMIDCGHPAPPSGGSLMLSGPVTTRPRASGDGLSFFERQGSHHSGEFTDEERSFWVLEPPLLHIPADMDAIREDLAARERAANASMDDWR